MTPSLAAAAYGMYPAGATLSDIVYTLNRAGFENEDICMVLSPTHPVATVIRDAKMFSEEREASAISARMIGWFSEFGAVVIPTIGFFIRSRAFFHALVVEENSGSLNGESRTLVGLGFAKNDAERLSSRLCDVGVLVYVSCQESARIDGVIELLRRTGALEAASIEKTIAHGAVA